MSGIISFFKSHVFWVNLLASILVVFLVFFGVYNWLNHYTRHGQTITVPDLKGKRFTDLQPYLKSRNLKVKVADSSIFDMRVPPGSVLEQDPPANSLVKEGRAIYVTITRTAAPEIEMPNLIDVSLRQAEAILQSFGLKVGELIYKPDLAKNAVLAMQIHGYEIHPGNRVSKGTSIDLVLGDGMGNTQVSIPDLNTLTLEEALFVLKGSGLLAGNLDYDESVRDSALAKIYRQYPEHSDSITISQGQVIDLYLTQSPSKLKPK